MCVCTYVRTYVRRYVSIYLSIYPFMSYLFRESRLRAGSWAEDFDFRDQSLGRREMLAWLETYHENSARCNGLQFTLLRYRPLAVLGPGANEYMGSSQNSGPTVALLDIRCRSVTHNSTKKKGPAIQGLAIRGLQGSTARRLRFRAFNTPIGKLGMKEWILLAVPL